MASLQPCLDGRTGSARVEFRMLCKDGSWKWILGRGMVVSRDSDGKPLRMIGTNTDITERKQIEEVQSYLLQMGSLTTGEDFFESLARYLAKILGMDYVCIDRLLGDCLSAKTLAVYHDGKFEDNVEYTLKDTPCGDVVGKEVCVFPREVRNLFPHDAALQDLQAESYVGTTLWSFDMKPIGLIAVIGRKELNSSHFAETVLKLVSIRAAGELGRRQAEEEKHALEQQYQQTQKLESLGVLAGGIAHDFNNILAIIMGYCSLTKMDYENAEKNIPEIEKAAERAAALCKQMLAYAGQVSLSQAKINTRMLVDEMVSMLKTTIQQNVVIKPNLSHDIPAFTGDASQIRQVVMNLIINAAEAIGEVDGEIDVVLTQAEITTKHEEKDHHGVIIPAGRYILIQVTDSGCGMDDNTRRKIFEPFYTTKFTGRGLGMSAVLGIIKGHHGALQLESRLGHGSTFKIYLPVQSSTETEEANQKTASAAWHGSGTILLAEDEEQVKSVAIILLQELGFRVLDAANGKEALELYQQNAADIRLVITDMGMPVMNGYELFYKLKQLNPQLPIIITSGFGEAEIASKVPREEIAGLLNKPYRFEQLRDVLKRGVEGVK
jgi:signal transduction histidine kinase/CheY-like chemotaxis protein